MSINYTDFIHPEDDAARRNLEALPGFSTITKWFLEVGLEQLIHGLFMAEKIRLSSTQLPEIYGKLPPICQKFGINEPEFYLEMNPVPNAYTTGDKQVFMVVTSGLLEHLNDDEVSAVLAHECGHILCRHVFYHTMAKMLLTCAEAMGVLGKMVYPVQIALNYWSRRSELSADRAEIVYMGNSQAALSTLVRLAGGPYQLTGKVNIEEYARQALDYQELQSNSKWHKILQSFAVMNNDHPFSAVRAKELMNWENSEQFKALRQAMEDVTTDNYQGAKCPSCGEPVQADWKFCRNCGNKLK